MFVMASVSSGGAAVRERSRFFTKGDPRSLLASADASKRDLGRRLKDCAFGGWEASAFDGSCTVVGRTRLSRYRQYLRWTFKLMSLTIDPQPEFYTQRNRNHMRLVHEHQHVLQPKAMQHTPPQPSPPPSQQRQRHGGSDAGHHRRRHHHAIKRTGQATSR